MIKRAFALSYLDMKDLIFAKPELLERDTFISILAGSEQSTPQRWVLPTDNLRCLTVFYDDLTSRSALYHPPEAVLAAKQMTVEDADNILNFLLRSNAREGDETLYVHCTRGISRSTAIVVIASELFGLQTDCFGCIDKATMYPNDIQLPLLRERSFHLNAKAIPGRLNLGQATEYEG